MNLNNILYLIFYFFFFFSKHFFYCVFTIFSFFVLRSFIESGKKSLAFLDSMDESTILIFLFIISSPWTNNDLVFTSNTGIKLSKIFEFACYKLSKIMIQFLSFLMFASIPSNNKVLISLIIILPSFLTGIFLQKKSSAVVLSEMLKYVTSYHKVLAR